MHLRIKVFKTESGWRADPIDLPGSPPNGSGPDRWSAVGSLLFAIRNENKTWAGINDWPWINIVDENGVEFAPYPIEGIDK